MYTKMSYRERKKGEEGAGESESDMALQGSRLNHAPRYGGFPKLGVPFWGSQ